MQESPIYNELNKAWKSTCKVVLGEEIGELKDYEEWLREYYPSGKTEKSHISNKDVIFAKADYCDSAKFISLDEVTEKKIDSLSINEIKDIDSIVEAISEKWEYTGNKILGKSSFVESSDNIIDSHYVLNSANVKQASHIFSSYYVSEGSRYIFGCNWSSKTEFQIKSGGYNTKRCFEANWSDNGGDLYFSYYCLGCNDLLFSFSQRNKRYLIGNLQLPADQYRTLKQKLIGEIREELKKKKTFPSLLKFVPDETPSKDIRVDISQKSETTSMAPIENSFSSTFRILFKKDPGSIVTYGKWLGKHFPEPVETITPFGSKIPGEWILADLCMLPKKRMITQEESIEISKIHLEEKDIESIEKIKETITKIGFFVAKVSERSTNVIDTPIAYHLINAYKIVDGNFSENCGICGSILHAKYLFGCHKIHDSQFDMNCYTSYNLNRCFEVDMSSNCSDTYFAHNCEGLADTMFCFNAKAKRNAIGNTELPPEKYRKIKDAVIEQMADEILKKKELKLDIFNIGCSGK